MPVYEYVCQDCRKPSELRASVEEYSKGVRPACPHCGSLRLIRTFSVIGLATGSGPRSGGAGCGPNAGPGCCGG
ncbi:MAG: zinc ribbon domain-containing protein [Thermoanaerobaculaceae bacterium]|nr:zinc ribbon domain-containing protein [Thermoanaerobaculaceae bacterium]